MLFDKKGEEDLYYIFLVVVSGLVGSLSHSVWLEL